MRTEEPEKTMTEMTVLFAFALAATLGHFAFRRQVAPVRVKAQRLQQRPRR